MATGGHTDDVTAVFAHSLLTPVSACRTAAGLLLADFDSMSPERRSELLALIVTRSRLMIDMLADFVRGTSEI